MKDREIQNKIAELKSIASRDNIDIHDDLNRLVAKLAGQSTATAEVDAWARVEAARHVDRPTCMHYISSISEEFIELHGDRCYRDDPALVGGIARINGVHFTFLGHQKGRSMKENLRRNYGMAHPEGYRKALRLAHQAEKFGRPIVTFIDTPGAYPGVASEERGISEAIARNLKEFSLIRTPIICVVIGEGGSGGALGIGVGDRTYMMENSTYSVISPEGCASILLRDPKKARQAAHMMKMTAHDLRGFGIVEGIIPEPNGGAHIDPDAAGLRLRKQIFEAYEDLSARRMDTLLKERSKRILSVGVYFEAQTRQANPLRRFFGRKGWSAARG